MAGEEGASFTLSQEELYRLGLSFYKEQEAKGLQVAVISYLNDHKKKKRNKGELQILLCGFCP